MSTILTTTTANLADLGLTANPGDTYFDSTAKKIVVWDGSGWSVYNNDGIAQPYSNNYSVLFDGVDDVGFADLGFNASTLNAYSVSAFVKFHGFGSRKAPYGISGSGSVFSSSVGRFDAANNYDWYHYGAGYQECSYPATTLQTGQWYHFAHVWDGTSVKLFLDASLVATVTTGNTATASGNMNIYVGRSEASNKLNCEVDELALWYTDESANMAQIRDEVTGMPKDLSQMTNKPAHWYRMGDGAGNPGTTTISDQGFDDNLVDMTLSGGATIQTGAGATPGT